MDTASKAPAPRGGRRRTTPAPRKERVKRPDQDLVDMVILDFPRTLKKALIREAGTTSNMTNVAVAALAADYGIAFVPSDRAQTTKPGDSSNVSFAMPRQLRHAISVDAAQRDMSKRDVVIEHLLARYGGKKR